jgi:hypothetical protein
MLTSETGAMIEKGGIIDQPDWFIENLFWFLPRYNSVKFYSRAASILGNDDKKASNLLKGQRNGRNK